MREGREMRGWWWVVYFGVFSSFFCVFLPSGNEVSRNRELVRILFLRTGSTLWVFWGLFIKVGLRLRRKEREIRRL